jgi:outer membrane protein TolC
MAYVPTLNAFGEYLFNDAEAFGFGSDSYLIGAQLSWKIFNGTATKNKVDAQRSERDKAVRELQYQKEQAQLELSKTQRQQQDARLTVNQQALAVQQAEEALRLIQNRYEQGLVTTTDLLQAQTMVSQQKLIWAQAVFQLNTTQAYLRFLTTTSNE